MIGHGRKTEGIVENDVLSRAIKTLSWRIEDAEDLIRAMINDGDIEPFHADAVLRALQGEDE